MHIEQNYIYNVRQILYVYSMYNVPKVSSLTTWFAKDRVEDLECPAQCPGLDPTEHF